MCSRRPLLWRRLCWCRWWPSPLPKSRPRFRFRRTPASARPRSGAKAREWRRRSSRQVSRWSKNFPPSSWPHGWGGTAALLRADALAFARAGYLVVTFDYRGWGESESRVILTAPEPSERSGNRFVAEVMELREIVDPVAELADWFNALHWVQAEPQSDISRLGIWGTSFAAGLVIYVAGTIIASRPCTARSARSTSTVSSGSHMTREHGG